MSKNNEFVLFSHIISINSDLFSKLSHHLSNPNLSNESNSLYLIHIAAFNGNINAIKHLLSKNANINVQDENGMTPLILSIIKGQVQISKLLIDSGCIAILVDKSGHMASH